MNYDVGLSELASHFLKLDILKGKCKVSHQCFMAL